MSDKLDVVGIGNAMVDAIIPSNQREIEKHEINRDSMNLIDENLKNNLHESYSIREMAGGGSLGNSMFGITSFGGNGSFIGKIKNDEIGVYLQKDMIREGLKFPLGFTSPDIFSTKTTSLLINSASDGFNKYDSKSITVGVTPNKILYNILNDSSVPFA